MVSEFRSGPVPVASKSSVKKAKGKAEKISRKKPDPAGLEVLEKAHKAFAEKKFNEALSLYEEARILCEKSSAVAVKAPRLPKQKPKAPVKTEEKEEPPEDISERWLKNPTDNKIAKFCDYEFPESENYAINHPGKLEEHLKKTGGMWKLRFPPEPNGYLHVGHAKAINFNFNTARTHQGECILRFDDTNPTAEKQEYIDAIIDNVRWLGNKWSQLTYSSDYFQELYEFAVQLIKQGQAYVCHQNSEEVKASRLAIQDAKSKKLKKLPAACYSPNRDRSVEENLRLFEGMRTGCYEEGHCCLRMKIDLNSDIPSMWDPTAYRIMYHPHPRTGDAWCIYPTYDYTHCIVDALENITHSCCTLEFASRQAPNGSYYWLLDALGLYKPQTFEYSRLNITYTVTSKRKINKLVAGGYLSGWNDPRITTLDGLRRRGYTASSINMLCALVGVTKNETVTDYSKLEFCVRREFEKTANRAFAILDPLKVSITNIDEAKATVFNAANHPQRPEMGTRKLTLGPVVYIDRSDFRESNTKGYFRLAPGKTVRLLFSLNITCNEVIKNASGIVTELKCSINTEAMLRPKGKIQWVTATESVEAEIRLYDRLFTVPTPDADGRDFMKFINPNSLLVKKGRVEKWLMDSWDKPGLPFQFQRLGYFCIDRDSRKDKLVFNRTTSLREASGLKAVGK